MGVIRCAGADDHGAAGAFAQRGEYRRLERIALVAVPEPALIEQGEHRSKPQGILGVRCQHAQDVAAAVAFIPHLKARRANERQQLLILDR